MKVPILFNDRKRNKSKVDLGEIFSGLSSIVSPGGNKTACRLFLT